MECRMFINKTKTNSNTKEKEIIKSPPIYEASSYSYADSNTQYCYPKK